MLEGFYLSLMIGPTVPVPAPRPVVEALIGAQVTVSSGQRSGFQLTFALSKQSMLSRILLPVGYFDPERRVILIATVNGIPSVLLDGVITRQDLTPSNDPGQSTLTVTGEDLTRLMDLDEINRSFPAMPPEARVELIMEKYAELGMVPVVVPSVFIDVPNPFDRNNQERTDLDYIDALAKLVGYVFYLDPGPVPGMNLAYWGPEVKVGIPQPALNVNMDASTNVESLSFSYDGFSKTRFIIELMIPDQFPKTTISMPAPDIGPLNPPLGVKPIPASRVQKLPETAGLTLAQAEARGLARASQSADVISASGQLDVLRYGRVLKARHLVGVRGAGLTYDGLYYVKSVTHNIKRGEYKQNFTLSRNALISFTPVVPP